MSEIENMGLIVDREVDAGRKRALRPTERQHRWLDEGQKWAASQSGAA